MDNKEVLIQKLRTENELKTKWIALLVHDAENLLSGFNWLVNAYESKEIPAETVLAMLPEIAQQVQLNQRNFQDTSLWIRQQIREDKPALEHFELALLLSEIRAQLEQRLAQKQVTLQYEGDPSIAIYQDKVALRFILTKMVENAIKYSYPSGKIAVRASCNLTHLHLEIEDYGIGMDENVLGSLFSLDGSIYLGTQQEKGGGLSLLVVNYFVTLLAGTIKVSSVLGKGTLFELIFPLDQEAG